MITQKIKKNKAFAILFAVTISSIVLAIALGVANTAFNELKFSTSARDTNDAFFATDTGIESVLYQDLKTSGSICSPDKGKTCTPLLPFTVTDLGSSGLGCANISVTKDYTNNLSIITTIVSKGYDVGGNVALGTCTQTDNSIERELQVSY